MRLIMMGTGPFAVPTFRGLFETDHEIVALVTGPIKRRGRGKVFLNPMRDVANEHAARIIDPEDINTEASQGLLTELAADLLIVCDYGQILATETLATARLGGINLHSSLLPKYRGAAPIVWAVYNGDTTTGVSVIHMTPRVDAGPVIAQSPPTPIGPEETAEELEIRLSEIGAWLTRRAIDSLAEGRLESLPQDPALASKAPRIKKSDGLIDWNRPAEAIRNHVRAMQPWPKTYAFWHRSEGKPVRLIIGPLQTAEDHASEESPVGTVLHADDHKIAVQTGDGVALLTAIQPAGKRLMSVEDFQRGYRMQTGDRLGAE